MITRAEVIQKITLDWIKKRFYEEKFGETLDEAAVRAELREEWEVQKAEFVRLWGQPEETPCGWIFYLQVSMIGGNAWFLVDLWTGEIINERDVYNNPYHPLTPEAALRVYIDRLPEPQRREAQVRMQLLPYEPVRFYPPYLDFPTNIHEESRPRIFEVEFDPVYFARRELPVPDLILVDVFFRLLTREERDQDVLLTVELPEAIQRISRTEKDGVIRDRYRLTIPAYRAPSLPRRNARHLEIRCQYPGISPALEELVKEEYFDRCSFPLDFP